MEKSPLITNLSSFPFFVLIDIIFTCIYSDRIHKFFSRFWFSLKSHLDFTTISINTTDSKNKLPRQSTNCTAKEIDEKIGRNEVEMVMGSLGIFCDHESEGIGENFNSDEISSLFEEKEPSLEEIKEAFDVFDENKDGFIDGWELKRVLCVLGLKQELEIVNCEKMIRNFDENGDGKIDFHEFVKFMENSFC